MIEIMLALVFGYLVFLVGIVGLALGAWLLVWLWNPSPVTKSSAPLAWPSPEPWQLQRERGEAWKS